MFIIPNEQSTKISIGVLTDPQKLGFTTGGTLLWNEAQPGCKPVSIEEWALDFVTDALARARHVRILTVVDVFTRECLALETDTSMGSLRVLRIHGRIVADRGPQRIRSDNDPKFTRRAYLAWSLDRHIDLVHIRHGKPIENAYAESFNGCPREECLNVSWSRVSVRGMRSDTWPRRFAALGYRTAEEFAALNRATGQSIAVWWGKGSQTPTPCPPSLSSRAPNDESCRMLR